ncbi:hypothetical protein ONE63_001082 [Megalurothrips usitatus]|uniref:Uncharacterized protein n=1 Tax=Megalurothrips usitatus TaxID=439358 RepID=A0AAV7XF11_9NEOP|nr:hypothetical protein ONE63_001082 [Megalurothrips usitatus]
MADGSQPKSRTSLWREKAQSVNACKCEYHQQVFNECASNVWCDCEYHNSVVDCQCEYHCDSNGEVSDCCEYHSGISQSTSSQHSHTVSPSNAQPPRSILNVQVQDGPQELSNGWQVHALREDGGGGYDDDNGDDVGGDDDDNDGGDDNDDGEESNNENSGSESSSDDEDGSEDPHDPDDPDDPLFGANGSDSSESDPDQDMREGAQHFPLRNERLDMVLDVAAGRTTREVVAMVIALALQMSLNYETVVMIFNILHSTLALFNLPVTKDQLWSCLNRNTAGIRKNVYCSRCFKLLGRLEVLPNPVLCDCGWTKPKKRAKYFITLNVKSQLQNILNLPFM